MLHAHVRRASAAALLGFAAAAAHAQPPWPLDPATLPAAITGIPPGIGWPSPPLGEGPFLVESVRPEHRTLRVVVVARGLEQPWSIAFLPDGDMLVTERPGRLRLIRDGVLDPNPVRRRARGARARLAGLHGRRAAPALRGQPLCVSLVSPPGRRGRRRNGAGPRPLGERCARRRARHLRDRHDRDRGLAHRLCDGRHAAHDDQRAGRRARRRALAESAGLRRQDDPAARRRQHPARQPVRRTIRATCPRSTRSGIATAIRWC